MTQTRATIVTLTLGAALAAGCMSALPAAAAPGDRESLATEYREFLDRGRTPSLAVEFVRGQSSGFRAIDPSESARDGAVQAAKPGDRLLFINRDRTAILVVIGQNPVATGGIRLIGTHIDTPAPRVSLVRLTASGQRAVLAHSYGGIKAHHWLHRPLALVGRVARAGGEEIEISLGLEDDFVLYASKVSKGDFAITTGSIAADAKARKPGGTRPTLVSTLHNKYGLKAADLLAAELYLVPAEPAREVGVDRELIGAHGQDDRANSYVAWRAIVDLPRAPKHTAVVWLADREETGSTHVAGAQSRFLEMVMAYLLRAQDAPATEASLARAFAASVALSADTPPALNPNWPEVQEVMHAPVLGKGVAMFPHTGRGGKRGGSQANAEFVRAAVASFERAGAPMQFGELGRVDEGGGGTIARFLAERGMEVVDIGVPVVGIHSPLEISAKDDLWTGYIGFRAWLLE